MSIDVIEVELWGKTIAAVSWDPTTAIASFEYTPEFQASGIQIAPLVMPLGPNIYSFPELSRPSFRGLPGALADSLPDRFGNILINTWLIRSGRADFTPLERLCYIGQRGMGALEFKPAFERKSNESTPVEIASLVNLANKALSEKESLTTRIGGTDNEELESMRDILQVGTSAGGARAKALIAWNEDTNEVRTGQVKAPPGFGYWLLKFDGVSGNRDKELEDPGGYGRTEYAYHRMALAAKIKMSECRLHHENGRSHFMTRRFDRTGSGGKILLQSLCAIAHLDFNRAGAYSYEQAMQVAHDLSLGHPAITQLYRRMAFNVFARNQDDHTKNIAFLMDQMGRWTLAPAFDVTYSYNPNGLWTRQHQMTINGKTEDLTIEDLYAVARRFRIGRKNQLDEILEEVDESLDLWPDLASEAGVSNETMESVRLNHRRLRDLHE